MQPGLGANRNQRRMSRINYADQNRFLIGFSVGTHGAGQI